MPRRIAGTCAALDLDPADLDSLERTLAPDERARVARFHLPKDRRFFVVTRGVLRDILARYLGRGPDELCFGRGHYNVLLEPHIRLVAEQLKEILNGKHPDARQREFVR